MKKVLSHSSVDRKTSSSSNSRQVFNQNYVFSSACQICSLTDKKIDMFFICNKCFLKYAQDHDISEEDNLKFNKGTADYCNFSKLLVTNFDPGYKLLAFCKNPFKCRGLIQLNSVVYDNSFFHIVLERTSTLGQFCCILRDNAARVIQKSWKK